MEVSVSANSGDEAVTPLRSISVALRLRSAIQTFAFSRCIRNDGTANRTLESFLMPKQSASIKPINGVSTRDIFIDAETDAWARIFTPTDKPSGPNVNKLPVLVYYHGGGFVMLSPSTAHYDRMCRKLAVACRAMVVSFNYRLAPEFRYPAAHDDSFRVLEWLQSSSEADLFQAADLSQCFLIGDSAGANLVHFMGCRAVQRDLSPVRIKGMVLLHPFFGGVARSPVEIAYPDMPFLPLWNTDRCWKSYLPEGADRDHPVCNVFGPECKDISDLPLPPILVTIGSLDILRDWQARYAEKLQEMNKQVHVVHNDLYHAEYVDDKTWAKLVEVVETFVQSLVL